MVRRALPALVFVLIATLTPLVVASPAGSEQPIGALPSADDFVIQQYEDFLSRRPDSAGLSYWRAQITDGIDPAALVESLAVSDEFEGTIAPVVRLYYAHFLRPPDYDGMTYWAGVARDGWSMEKISEEFVRSNEFVAAYGGLTDAEYVDQVYQNVLGRPSDAVGKVHWTGALGRGMSRGAVMVAFSDSVEYRRAIGSRVLATMLYVGVLRRAPEPGGLDYWASVIERGTPYRNVIAGFLGAAEYRERMKRIYRETHPLTGVATRTVANRPALAVKIDNVDRARPPTSIDRADIIYEEQVEGRLTRLVAVFHSDVPDVVGPVRSVRTTDIDILAPLNTPLLAASGANAGVLAAVEAADVVNVNALAVGVAYFRDNRRRAPHNMYVRPADLYAAVPGQGGLPPVVFRFRPAGTGSTAGTASAGVRIEFGAATIDFDWSATRRAWLRRQNGSNHVTADGSRLAPVNVVVMEVDYGPSNVDANSPHAHTVGSGPVHVFTDGKVISGRWSRQQADEPIALNDDGGQPILLTRGQTMVELAPVGTVQVH